MNHQSVLRLSLFCSPVSSGGRDMGLFNLLSAFDLFLTINNLHVLYCMSTCFFIHILILGHGPLKYLKYFDVVSE